MMQYDPHKHHRPFVRTQGRRSIRLKGYDYTQAGAYFVTIVTEERACLFGEIMGGEMRLNSAGKIVQGEWRRLEGRFAQIRLGAFVVMPNHVHGIIVIDDDMVGATHVDPSITSSGMISVQADAINSNDGSPVPDTAVMNGNDGATRGYPTMIPSDRSLEPIEAEDDKDGSPVPHTAVMNGNDGSPVPPIGLPPSANDFDGNDGATRGYPTMIPSDRSPELIEAEDGDGGSPLHPTAEMNGNDGSPVPDTTVMNGDGGSPQQRPTGPAPGSLGAIIGQFKSRVTKRLWRLPQYAETAIWQRNYYEHIIRNDQDFMNIWNYIEGNPQKWEEDQLHTPAMPKQFDQRKIYG